jgi:hypothetical protein
MISFDTSGWTWSTVLLLLVSGVLVLLTGSTPMYWWGLVVLTAVGVIGLGRCILAAQQLTVWHLLTVSLCLGYGLGTLNTELTWLRTDMDFLSVTSASRAAVTQTVGWLLLLCAVLMACGSLDSRRCLDHIQLTQAQQQFAVWALALVTLAALAQIATGAIGYHQDMTGDGVRISPWAALTVGSICPVAAAGAFVIRATKGWQRWVVMGCLVLLTLVQFYQGRRVLIYTTVVCLIFFFAAGRPARLFTRRNVVVALVGGLALVGASKAFFAMRLAHWEMADQKMAVMPLLERTGEILLNAQRVGLSEEASENQSSRTFIISYLAEILEALDTHEPLYGRVMQFDLAMNVPSAIWPDKYKYIYLGAEEVVANPELGLTIVDEANSILTTGACDFGVPGMLLYPVVLAWLYSLVLRHTRRFGAMAHLMIAAALVNTVLNVEAATVDYMGVFRSMILVGGCVAVAIKVWRYLTVRHAPALPWPKRLSL